MDSRIEQEFEEYIYRIYISDGLYSLLGNYKQRYVEYINNTGQSDPEQTCEEIVSRVMNAGGLTFEE